MTYNQFIFPDEIIEDSENNNTQANNQQASYAATKGQDFE